ncbi:MAG: hypothetical protein ABIP38_12885 [Steroidobacteraceae bacterium]
MSLKGFSAAWLALREPADQRARDPGLLASLTEAVRGRPTLQVVDLGSGSGSNLRALAPWLPHRQEWWLLDHDAQLLAAVRERMQQWAVQSGWTSEDEPRPCLLGAGREVGLRIHQADLARGLAGAAVPALRLDSDTLVTGAALLDLVSQDWLAQLVTDCCTARAMVYFSLSYDGRLRCDPQLPDDPLLQRLVNQHQLRDKGFGAALGPQAVNVLRQLLAAQGYQCRIARSDWMIGPDEAQLQRELVNGWAVAAIEMDANASARIHPWQAARCALIAAGHSRLCVGHLDILALPGAD